MEYNCVFLGQFHILAKVTRQRFFSLSAPICIFRFWEIRNDLYEITSDPDRSWSALPESVLRSHFRQLWLSIRVKMWKFVSAEKYFVSVCGEFSIRVWNYSLFHEKYSLFSGDGSSRCENYFRGLRKYSMGGGQLFLRAFFFCTQIGNFVDIRENTRKPRFSEIIPNSDWAYCDLPESSVRSEFRYFWIRVLVA